MCNFRHPFAILLNRCLNARQACNNKIQTIAYVELNSLSLTMESITQRSTEMPGPAPASCEYRCHKCRLIPYMNWDHLNPFEYKSIDHHDDVFALAASSESGCGLCRLFWWSLFGHSDIQALRDAEALPEGPFVVRIMMYDDRVAQKSDPVNVQIRVGNADIQFAILQHGRLCRVHPDPKIETKVGTRFVRRKLNILAVNLNLERSLMAFRPDASKPST